MTARDEIRRLMEENPRRSLAELSALVGVSRERVRQILETEGMRTLPSGRRGGYRIPAIAAITGGVPVAINGTTAGHVAELLAAADLGARGFAVFIPLLRTERCDLITMQRDSGRLERIEVRSGYRSGKRIVWRKADAAKSDRRAIVITGEPVAYDPPFDE